MIGVQVKAAFLNSSATDVWSQATFVVASGRGCGASLNIAAYSAASLGFYPMRASSDPSVRAENTFRYCQMSLRGKIVSSL